jgi:hypothetical protein
MTDDGGAHPSTEDVLNDFAGLKRISPTYPLRTTGQVALKVSKL